MTYGTSDLDRVPASADPQQLMAKEETSDDGSGLGEVQITVVVVPGRVQSTLAKLRVGARVRAGLASVGVLAAITAGAIIVVSSSSGHASRAPDSDAMSTQLRLGSNCSRLRVGSPDGTYARVELDRAGPCGTFGSHATLILRRLHGVSLREFETSSWACPTARLPHRVAITLHLCGPNLTPPRATASPSLRSR
jgi:hypothetical protein